MDHIIKVVIDRLRTSHLFVTMVDINTEAEEYVINNLRTNSLPYLACYDCGHFINGMEIMKQSQPLSLSPVLLEHQHNFMSYDRRTSERNIFDVLFNPGNTSYERPIRLFVSGDRSSVGKSSTCLALLSALVASGVHPNKLAYIKPVTQCEAEQPVAVYCQRVGIHHRSIGPVVFYQGFTRAYLAGETPTADVLLANIVESVEDIERGKSIILIDGVGYPSVGSICNVSNGHVAAALRCPVVLVGKSGVGDAVDSYNLNAVYLESFGVKVLGGIFNKIDREGFYNLQACQQAVTSYFQQFKPWQLPYGFVPKLAAEEMLLEDVDSKDTDNHVTHWSRIFMEHVDLGRLVHDAWLANVRLRISSEFGYSYLFWFCVLRLPIIFKIPQFPVLLDLLSSIFPVRMQ